MDFPPPSLSVAVPSTRIPTVVVTLISYVLPPIVGYFAAALLVVMPNTRIFRIALWPVVALLALRAAASVEISHGNPKLRVFNVDLVVLMFLITVRTLEWTVTKEPLVRHLRPANASPSIIMDALDLVSNFRGHGWGWSHGVCIPRETRPRNRIEFVSYAFLSGAVHALICGILHQAALAFTSGRDGDILGRLSIFDETLPPTARYFRASVISTCLAFFLYAVMQMRYDLFTIVGVLLFRQDPAQWPPAFNSPWRATSLNDFWGRRWHQWYRYPYLFLGGYPLSSIFGRAGTVFGTFFASAFFHYLTVVKLDTRSEMWRMLAGFGMMAPGVLAERAFYRLTGRKVGGIAGWVWTMAWLLLWGTVMIEGLVKAGMYDCLTLIDGDVVVRPWVVQQATNFDTWLHGI